MRLALLTTMAAAALTLGGCAAHPMMPMRMAYAPAAQATGTCPMAEASATDATAPGHVHGHGMQGMHGAMHGGMHGMHGGMHGGMHAHAGPPGMPAGTCPAQQPNAPRQ